MATALKALSDKMRLQIVGLLAHGPKAVEEIAAATALSAPTVSHHLARLRTAGIVSSEREQYYTVYRLDEDRLREIGQRLGSRPRALVVAPSSEAAADAYDRGVLERFLVDGRLVSIPRQRKKRAAVLRYLARRFEAGRDYPEREVNALLGAYHDDVATLRRELICENLLDRSAGLYRRA